MNLYHDNGKTPRFIRCWEFKRKPEPVERFTVVFTNTVKAGLPAGISFSRAMNAAPFHGYGVWGECATADFAKSHGTPIPFSDLPPDCQRAVQEDYKSIWVNFTATTRPIK